MRKFLRSLFRKPRVQIGWTTADGIGLTDEHPTFNAADRARTAIDAYKAAHDSAELLETVASDLLADLFHLLVTEGEDPAEIVSRAELHFEAEYHAEPVFA
ncbi:hypothetical protein [Streptomyces prunicolor]|uniref:hypothetical protein n=1 Tax=Streptomyces prunicolor TaxID=67348 RepID=UPI0033ED4344